MSIRLYNTAHRRKENFIPLKKGKAGIYVCGVTVYDLCHIGHARSAIVFDVLTRYFRAKGLDVTYVRNFTDIDDKIIKRANELGKETSDLAREYIDAFHEDMGRLGVLDADVEPRATGHIDGMIDMISALLDRSHAYQEDNEVFFSVESLKEYGELSGRKLEDMQAGSRIPVDEKKRHPMDFVLWKGAKPEEPQWDSPWGPGRPGWHLECSVMSNHYLGISFDIHGGGKDLLFPHHENERAQSIGANGGNFARYWVHNGFVTIESEKMSKSLGNFLTIRDALASHHPQVLRLFLLSKHYRSPLDFSKDAVQSVQSGLVRIYRTLRRLDHVLGPREKGLEHMPDAFLSKDRPTDLEHDPFIREFISAMDEDLNTAGAIGLMFEKVREINKLLDSNEGSMDASLQNRLSNDRQHIFLAGRVLGLLEEDPARFFNELSALSADKDVDPSGIEKMIEQRAAARNKKDWDKSDEIRDRLKDMGVVLEDGPRGTTWRLDV
ncbi:MAG: cysteine--tRNA ligase [Desulfobacterales bacterium]|nr:cysteine--tRNA ligase [Desulfobacterales bacterium]